MNFIDVTPEALPLFTSALNPNVRVIGTVSRHQVCRFILDVSAIYDGPHCQWTCEFSMDKGITTITFKPHETSR